MAVQKSNERDLWQRIVVKVISWSDGLHAGGIIKPTDKITEKEWRTYCSRLLKIDTSDNKKKTKLDLEQTRVKIESFKGFAK